MAEIREIVITLKNKAAAATVDSAVDVGAFSGAAGESSGSESSGSGAATSSSSSSGMARAAFAGMILDSVAKVGNSMLSRADYEMDRVFTLKDDYIGQRRMAEAQQYINTGTSYVSSIARGAVMGSSAGPLGAVVGAAIGLLTQAFGKKNEVSIANDRQNIALKQMDLQLQYTRRRAGWSLNAASIGEDL